MGKQMLHTSTVGTGRMPGLGKTTITVLWLPHSILIKPSKTIVLPVLAPTEPLLHFYNLIYKQAALLVQFEWDYVV